MTLKKCPKCRRELSPSVAICPTCDYLVWQKEDVTCRLNMSDKIIASYDERRLKKYKSVIELLDSAIQEYNNFKDYLGSLDTSVDIEQTQSHNQLKSIYDEYAYVMSKVDSPYYNLDKAIEYYERAGNLGLSSAYTDLGRIYDKNDTNFPLKEDSVKDSSRAIAWYKKAIALDGNSTALNNLGCIYAQNYDYHLGAFYCWCANQINSYNTVALNNFNSYIQLLSPSYQKYIKDLVITPTNISELEKSFLFWHYNVGKGTIDKGIAIETHIKKHKKKYIIGAIALALAFFIFLIALASIGSSGGENGDTRRCGSCHKVYEKYDDWGNLDDDYSSILRRGMCKKCYQNHKWSQNAVNGLN